MGLKTPALFEIRYLFGTRHLLEVLRYVSSLQITMTSTHYTPLWSRYIQIRLKTWETK